MDENHTHPGAWLVVAVFLGVFVWLMLGVANTPDVLARSVWRGVTLGHCLVLALHVLSVLAAWVYIFVGRPPAAETDQDSGLPS